MTTLRQRSKLVHGVGVNDADYVVRPRVDGKEVWCPAYKCWCNMLARCYDLKAQAKRLNYQGCSVDPRWHSFMAFRAWYMKNYVDGFALDKDCLRWGNKVYGPDTCIFIPAWLNSLTLARGAARGELPIGVAWHKASQKYSAHCNANGKQAHLGLFSTPEKAHTAWLRHKITHICSLKGAIDAIDPRLFPNILTIAVQQV